MYLKFYKIRSVLPTGEFFAAISSPTFNKATDNVGHPYISGETIYQWRRMLYWIRVIQTTVLLVL